MVTFTIIIGSLFILFLFTINLGKTGAGAYIAERLLANTASTRFLAFELFAKYFPENPFFGTGEHVTAELARSLQGRSSQIHVGYLSHLFEFGIFGSILLFSFWFYIAKRLFKTSRRFNYYGTFLGFLCFLVANLTLVKYSIFEYGIILSLLFNKGLEQNKSAICQEYNA